MVKYLDARLPLINAELNKHAVAILPVEKGSDGTHDVDPSGQGSGTCIRVGGRFFVATAAHVVPKFPETRYAVVTPETRNYVLRLIAGSRRGGDVSGRPDVAWLEFHPDAAGKARRHFLDLSRLAPYDDGENEDLCLYGAAYQDRKIENRGGVSSFTATGNMWPTRTMSKQEIPSDCDDSILRLKWPRTMIGLDDEPYDYPYPKGMSGGGVWSLNTRGHGGKWRSDQTQLIGVEFARRTEEGHEYLVAQRIHVWLEMLAEDVPELAETIRVHLAGSRVSIGR